MSLHLGSSKYDEHTVRKGISNWHFDHRVSKGVSIPCALSASQVTVKCVCCHASLGDKAAEPRHITSACPTIKTLLPIALPSEGCPPWHRSPQSPGQHPRPAPSRSPWERGDVPRGPDQRTAGDAASSGQRRMGLVLIASAGEASKARSEVSVARQEQPRCAR